MAKHMILKTAAAIAGITIIGAAGSGALTETFYPKVLRRMFNASDEKRDAGLKTPDGVERIDDLAYGTHPMQVLDVYFPQGTQEALPAIVSIHGGGYVYGDKERYQFYCMDLAERGFTVVNFSYRLAPEFRYPAQINDINEAVRYAAEHAQELHIDPEKMFFVGDSAGGQLLSQYAAAASNPAYAETMNLKIPQIHIRAIALNCGMYELSDKDAATRCYISGKVADYGDQLRVKDHINSDYPPAFVMSAHGDFLLEAAAPMSKLLTARGVENELHIYGSGDRPLGHVFHLNIRSEDAKICNDEECDFFRRFLEP